MERRRTGGRGHQPGLDPVDGGRAPLRPAGGREQLCYVQLAQPRHPRRAHRLRVRRGAAAGRPRERASRRGPGGDQRLAAVLGDVGFRDVPAGVAAQRSRSFRSCPPPARRRRRGAFPGRWPGWGWPSSCGPTRWRCWASWCRSACGGGLRGALRQPPAPRGPAAGGRVGRGRAHLPEAVLRRLAAAALRPQGHRRGRPAPSRLQLSGRLLRRAVLPAAAPRRQPAAGRAGTGRPGHALLGAPARGVRRGLGGVRRQGRGRRVPVLAASFRSSR